MALSGERMLAEAEAEASPLPPLCVHTPAVPLTRMEGCPLTTIEGWCGLRGDRVAWRAAAEEEQEGANAPAAPQDPQRAPAAAPSEPKSGQ